MKSAVRLRPIAPAIALLALCVLTGVGATVAQSQAGARQQHAARSEASQPNCGSPFDYQVLLDRAGFSPGEIDGAFGRNTGLALRAFQQSSNRPPTGSPDCATWEALRARDPAPTIVDYRVTDEDAAGPFVPAIPDDLIEQSKLDALGYTSVLEALGERFHVKPSVLARMNGGARLQSGASIRVPAVAQDFPALAQQSEPITSRTFVVEVAREGSAVVLLDAAERVVFLAPATVGSEHDPLPPGDWKIRGVAWNPKFHYNPDLFWDADTGHAKATIMPGPNNPVGIVWIDVNLPHYGIHGTPDPGMVGHSYSHGCVRLTNWDAARPARAVRPGMPVRFR